MKHLKLKKINIARINNLNLILGGNNRPTINQLPDSHACPPKETQDEYDTICQTTNGGTKTLGNVTTGFAETRECD